MSIYSRPVSPLERLSIAIDQVHSYRLIAVVEGSGTIDAGELRSAVARAAEANPGVRVRARGILSWARWVDSGVPPAVHAIEQVDWDGTSERGSDFLLAGDLCPVRGPVADVLLLPGPRVVFRAHHAAMDGRGMIHWIREVFRALRGEPLHGATSSITDHDVRRQWAERVRGAPFVPQPCIPVLPPVQTIGPGHAWCRAILRRRVPNLLAQTALFLAAYARRRQDGNVRFRVPVDFRGLRTSAVTTGNMIGYIPLPVELGDTVISVKRRMVDQLRDCADCRALPREKSIPWTPLWQLRHRIRTSLRVGMESEVAPSAGLVSLGRIDLGEARLPSFAPHAISIVPPPVGRMNVILLETTDGAVATFSTPQRPVGNRDLNDLAASFVSHFA